MAFFKAAFLSVVISASALASAASAGTIIHANEPFYNAKNKITFGERGFLGGQSITNQFKPEGVSFSGQLKWLSSLGNRKGVRGASLTNFSRDAGITSSNPFSVKFDHIVREVTFSLTGFNANFSVTALKRGRQVGYLESLANTDRIANDDFGFNKIRFDELLITVDDPFGVAFDNLHFDYAIKQRGKQRGKIIASEVAAVRFRPLFNQPEEPQPEVRTFSVSNRDFLSSGAGGVSPLNAQASAVAAVPLPAGLLLMLTGLGGLVAAGVRRKRA